MDTKRAQKPPQREIVVLALPMFRAKKDATFRSWVRHVHGLGLDIVCGFAGPAGVEHLVIERLFRSSGVPNGASFASESDPTPSRAGRNTFTVTRTTSDGVRLVGAHVSLEGDMSQAGMSPVFGETKGIVPGRYQGTLDLSVGGDWTVLFHITLPSGQTFDRQLSIRDIQAT